MPVFGSGHRHNTRYNQRMIISTLIILGAATARITTLLNRDEITTRLRTWVYAVSPPEDDARKAFYYQTWGRTSRAERVDRRSLGLRGVEVWFDTGKPKRNPGFVGRLWACPDCLSVWVALFVAGAYYTSPDATLTACLPFALALAASWSARRIP